MSYQVLARKWRPRTFHELVGQEHVSRALINALDNERLHHAYLFTGTRGVGKTTLARILAKCLNCEQGVGSQPCGECQTCRAIDEGRFVDLIEVDAASRTKVEDTRELLDNVQYAPTQGRYKVYLIDEVHMLSTHSFNALLKTLEEPPPHVKFLLATTDPQKLPVTVLSRCLQFTLKNMPPERVVEHLTRVLEAEQVSFDPQALWLLGRAADGSMRDAMSLTDQAIAFGQGEVRRDDVAAMLGTLDHAHLLALVEALADVDAERLLAEVASLAEQGPDFAGVLDEIAGLMHRLAIAQMVPGALDNGHGDREALLALAGRFTAEDVQLHYQIALQGRGDMDNAPDTRTALEMTLLRMLAFRPQGVPAPPQSDLPLKGQASRAPTPGDEAASGAPSTPAASSAAVSKEPLTAERAAPKAESEPDERSAGDPPPWAQDGDTSPRETPRASRPDPSAGVGPAASHESSDHQTADPRPDTAATSIETTPVAGDESPVDERLPGEPTAVSPSPSPSESPRVLEDLPPVEAMPAPATSGSDWPDSGDDDGDWDVDAGQAEAEAAYADWQPEAPAAVANAPVPDTRLADDIGQPANDGARAETSAEAPAQAVDVAAAGETASAREPQAEAFTGTLSHSQWLAFFDRLEIGGLTRNLAAHCVVAGDDGRALSLTLDPGQSAMLSDLHVERITRALAGVGVVRRVEIEVAPLDGELETAKAKRDREARERHARAVEALRGDPHVQELESRFGARLMEESVTADRI